MTAQENNEKITTVVLNVPEISCEHCKSLITDNLRKIQGISDINVNLKKKRVEVTFDPTIASIGQMENLIRQLGYSVESKD